MKKLAIFLTDSLKAFYQKGELKNNYYNPQNLFDEIHMISFCGKDINAHKVQAVAGKAKLFIHSVGDIDLFSFMPCLRRVLALIKSIEPDVIRAYEPFLKGAIAVWSSRRFKIPCIISVHTEPDEQRRFKRNPFLYLRIIFEKYAIGNSDCVICVTEYVARYAKRYGAKRVEVVYNGVPLAEYQRHKPENVFKRSTILSVGRLVRHKRQDCLIKAMRGMDMDLVIVGSGNQKPRLERISRKAGVHDRVFFIDSISHKDIFKYYLSCDIFAMATDFEGFCIPVIEAMAAGRPIIASDIPAIREILDGNGVLVKNSEIAFHSAFEDFNRNPGHFIEFGKAALGRVKMFDAPLIEESERKVYEAVCKL